MDFAAAAFYLLPFLFSKITCKGNIFNSYMQTFFHFFYIFCDFLYVLRCFWWKSVSLIGDFCDFCYLASSLDSLDALDFLDSLDALDFLDSLDSLATNKKRKTSQKGSLSFCCQTRIRRSACACCKECRPRHWATAHPHSPHKLEICGDPFSGFESSNLPKNKRPP